MLDEMRAEMTVDLDLKSLENLRIFNGYETEKKRRLSLEAPSSPEDNNESDTGQQEWTPSKGKSQGKSKCGRPANPIPRHKRDSHIKAEYKRRDKIQKGFDTLLSLVPELKGFSEKESKSKMLFKTADYCRQLKSECGNTQTELTALRQELETLGTEIQDLQDQLPQHGVDTVKKSEEVTMDTLYDRYVQEESKKNWKFWIFGFFMRPLYDSFKHVTSGKQETQELNNNVYQWMQNHLSLTSLRKGFLEALRKISKSTGIMTNPELLEQEAMSKVKDHCFGTELVNFSTALTPPPTPRARTPAPVSSAKCTPVQTPTPTPPRTPTVSRRSSKREIQRSTESRSRSNSPVPEENKPKRRSNYRSRSGRRGGDDQEVKMEYVTTAGNPNLPLLSHLLTSPKFVQTNQFGAVAKETAASDARLVPSHRKSSLETPMSTGIVTSSQDCTSQDQLITSFVESLISSMNSNESIPKSSPVCPTTTAELSQVLVSSSNVCMSPTASLISPCSQFINNRSEVMKMDTWNTPMMNGFVPVSSSGTISNGLLFLPDQLVTSEFQPLSNQFEAREISGFQPMDLISTVSNSENLLTEMPCLNAVMSGQTCTEIYSTDHESHFSMEKPGGMERTNSNILSQDEDSLTGQLSIDVMDVNSVMHFLNNNKVLQS